MVFNSTGNDLLWLIYSPPGLPREYDSTDQGTKALPIGTPNTNAVIREIAAPAKLNGNHFLIATEVLSKLYTHLL